MKVSPTYRSIYRFKVFNACLLSLLMLLAPMAPLAASVNRIASARAEQKAARALAKTPKRQLTAQEALERSLFVNPAPLAGPPVIGATLTDSFVDSNSSTRADPGSTVTYTAVISNTGGSDATNVTFTDTPDPNTTLVGGSVKVSPLAFADTYPADTNTTLNVGVPGVLTNDTGTPGPTAVAIVAGATTQGGTVTLNANGSFTYDPPSAVFNGADQFTYSATNGQAPNDSATVTINVAPASTPPTAVNDAATVNEDAAATAIDVLANDTDPDGGTKNIASLTQPANGTVVGTGPSGAFSGLTYQPNANYCNNPPGSALDSFTYTLNGGSIGTVNVTVTCINDAPSFTKGADQTVNEDSGAQTVNGWATAVSPGGGADEAGQTLTFVITNNTNAALFSAAPSVAANGDLTYTPATNANGTATITLKITDNGGTAGGGVDQSPTQTFVINVTAVNDVPSFTKGPDKTVLEDAGAQTFAGWATAISMGPADESGQTPTFNITNNTNSGLFSAGPAVAANGTLTFTPAANANGTATITLTLSDSGGTANGGVDTSGSQTFVINVTAVNDVPSFTKGADQNVNEDSGAQTAAGWATAISAGPADESGQILTFAITNNTNPALFSAGPAVAADGTLTYTPTANANGTATITLRISDNGGIANGGVDTSVTQTFVIMVGAVNDPPSFTKGPDQTVNEDAGAQTVSPWATAISAGPPDESGQTLIFVITNNTNPALFSAGPSVSSTGALTYTPAPNANGTAAITLKLTDSGGGTNESPTQTFNINVTAVNDAPVVDLNGSGSGGINTAATFTEDSGGAVLAGAAEVTDVDSVNLVSATITLTNRLDGDSVESLSVDTTGTLITAAPYVQGTGVLALSGTDTLANYQQVLRTVKYNNTSQNPNTTNRLVNFKANDGALDSATAVATVTVVAVNDAPVLTASGGFTYTENDAATAIAPAITVTDVDSTTLTQATITISANYQSGEDVLSFTNVAMGNIAIQSNTGGVLTLTSAGGTATLAQWQAALAAVKYNNTSEDPSTLQRTVTFQVNDGGAVNNLSNIVSRTITVVAVNDPPTANAFASLPAQAGIPITYPAGKLGGSDVAAEAANGSTVTINTTPNSNCASCLLTINANGSFVFTPPPSAAGTTVQFTYHVTDTGNPAPGVDSAAATVSFTVAGPAIYFVKQSAVGAGNCTLGNECTLATALTNIGLTANTRIFIEDNGAYTNSVTLNSNGWLIGQAVVAASFDALFGIPVPGQGTLTARPTLGQPAPTITVSTPATNVVNLTSAGTTNSVRGLNLTTGSSTSKGINGSTFGTLTTSELNISGSGPALDLTTGSLSGTFTSISSSGGTNNIKLTTIGGSSTFGSGALSAATGDSFLVSGGAGTFTYSGTIGSGSAHSVNIGSMTAGGVTFSGLITDTDTGINLTNNAGATIGFTGGLTLSTGTSTAFNATGGGPAATTGGTVNVTGATNTITTTTGTALNVVNTTIGASNITFKSISAGTGASGPASGIVLNNTGSTGHLTVTGDGNASVGGNSSGGTIQHTTSNGISLTTTTSSSFTNMNIHDTAASGVRGFTGVVNFTFKNGTINNSGTGGGNQESNIAFNDPSGSATDAKIIGTVTITGNTLTNALWHGVSILQFAGLLDDVNISNNVLTSGTTTGAGGTSLGSGIQLVPGGVAATVASVTQAELNNNTITNFPGGVLMALQGGTANNAGPVGTFGTPGSATKDIEVKNNILNGGGATILPNQLILATVNGKGVGQFTIQNNGTVGDPMSGSAGNAIDISAGGAVTVQATVTGNQINVAGQTVGGTSGIAAGVGPFDVTGPVTLNTATLYATVQTNSIVNSAGSGIRLNVNAGDPTLNAIVTGNTVGAPISATYGIQVQEGNNVGFTGNTNLQISGNTTTGGTGGGNTFPGTGLRKFGLTVGEYAIVGMSPSPGTNAQMETSISALNPGSAIGNFGGSPTNRVISISSTSNNWTSIASVPQPPALPLQAAPGGVEAAQELVSFVTGCDSDPNLFSPVGTISDRTTVQPSVPAASAVTMSLSQEQLDSIVAGALRHWAATGLTPEQLNALRGINFDVADLEGAYLGEAGGQRVLIDRKGAGKGWFVGSDSSSDSLFSRAVSNTRRYTDQLSTPAGHLDLLTAIEHEMGHKLGLDDKYGERDRDNLMYGYLTVGERRLPAPGQAQNAKPGTQATQHLKLRPASAASRRAGTASRRSDTPITPLVGGNVNQSIGTLPAGKSVTITFQVTLNTAMPSGTNEVGTQGAIHWTEDAGGVGGAGVPTDDPAPDPPHSNGATDKTFTPIDAPTAADSTVSGQIVDGNGNPVEGAGIRMSGTQTRLTVTDAQGFYHFDNVETNGFYTVIATRANFSFSPSQRSFSALGQHTDAAFSASPTGSTLNPLDTTEYFVRQQYVDFLNREPDEAGLNFWYNNIESCGNDGQCRAGKRTDTSAAFFLSIEFQQTGYLIYKSYEAAFGDLPGMPVPVRQGEFKPDTQEIGNGVIVNAPGWDTTLNANKVAFMAEFVQRSRFASAFPSSMTPSEFVNKLFANAGVTPSDTDRTAAVSEFGSGGTSSDVAARGRALQRVAENSMLTQQEFTQAFVLIQYFGYLRRDPNTVPDADFSGYNFWLQKLNTFNGNFGDAEMVKSFLVSGEYRGRFPR